MLMAYRVSGGVKCPGSRASLGALRPSGFELYMLVVWGSGFDELYTPQTLF